MVIDFKKNTSHNNTDQLLIFIYLFITSYLTSALLIGCTVSSAFLCKCCFFLCYRRQLKPHLHNNNASFCSCLFHWCISKVSCYEENLPQSIEATCVVTAAAASWLALLAAPCLYGALCQTAKQGKQWDKWLFMICHIPSSHLSPGPIYYSCRLPLWGKKTCTHKC